MNRPDTTTLEANLARLIVGAKPQIVQAGQRGVAHDSIWTLFSRKVQPPPMGRKVHLPVMVLEDVRLERFDDLIKAYPSETELLTTCRIHAAEVHDSGREPVLVCMRLPRASAPAFALGWLDLAEGSVPRGQN